MGFVTSKPEFTMIPAGVHRACLIRLVDLGRDPKYFRDQVAMQFEIYALLGALSLDENGHGRPPRVWTMPMTLSMYRKARLAALLAGWDGVDVDDVAESQDLEDRLGTWGRVEIVHETRNGRSYASIVRLAPLASGDSASLPQTYNKPSPYDVRDGRTGGFTTLPAWIQARAMESADWTGRLPGRSNATGNGASAGAGVDVAAHGSHGAGVSKVSDATPQRFNGAGGFDTMADDVPF